MVTPSTPKTRETRSGGIEADCAPDAPKSSRKPLSRGPRSRPRAPRRRTARPETQGDGALDLALGPDVLPGHELPSAAASGKIEHHDIHSRGSPLRGSRCSGRSRRTTDRRTPCSGDIHDVQMGRPPGELRPRVPGGAAIRPGLFLPWTHPTFLERAAEARVSMSLDDRHADQSSDSWTAFATYTLVAYSRGRTHLDPNHPRRRRAARRTSVATRGSRSHEMRTARERQHLPTCHDRERPAPAAWPAPIRMDDPRSVVRGVRASPRRRSASPGSAGLGDRAGRPTDQSSARRTMAADRHRVRSRRDSSAD